jgi:periplasmic protein TonB
VIVDRSCVPWIIAVATSCLVHVGVVAAAIVLAPFSGSQLDRLSVELVAPEPPAPPAAEPKPPNKPAPRKPRPLTLPRPIETPLPKLEEATPPAAPEPPPPPRRVEAPIDPPPPLATPSHASSEPTAGALTSAPSATSTDPSPDVISWPTAAPPNVSATDRGGMNVGPMGTTAPSVARGTGDLTSTAVPRGGYQVRPSYPSSARRLGIQGTSLLRVHVATDGTVSNVVVHESAGHPDLDRAAADAVRRWRFEPARRGTEAVAMWVLLPVEFHLK